MSLKRDEWIEMWDAIKRIELHSTLIEGDDEYFEVEKMIELIKDKIQSVIGQME